MSKIIAVGYTYNADTYGAAISACMGQKEAYEDCDLEFDTEVKSGVFYSFKCKGVGFAAQKTDEAMRNWFHTKSGDYHAAKVKTVYYQKGTGLVALELATNQDTFMSFVNHKAVTGEYTAGMGTSALKDEIRNKTGGWMAFKPDDEITIRAKAYIYYKK